MPEIRSPGTFDMPQRRIFDCDEEVDGNEYDDVDFHNVRLIYRGGELPKFNPFCNYLDGTCFYFAGPAALTLKFLRTQNPCWIETEPKSSIAAQVKILPGE